MYFFCVVLTSQNAAPRVLFTHTIFFVIQGEASSIKTFSHQNKLLSSQTCNPHLDFVLCCKAQFSLILFIFLVSFMAQTLKSLLLHERLVFSGMLKSKIKAQPTRFGLQLNYRKFNVSVKFFPDIRSHFITNFSPVKIPAAREIYCSSRAARKQPLARFQELHYCGLNSCRRRKSRIWLGECNPTLTAEFGSVNVALARTETI